jgi:transposase
LKIQNEPDTIIVAHDECFIHRATSIIRSWFPKGITPEILSPATYEKIGINGTINMETGEVYSAITDIFNADSFLDFVKNLISYIPRGKKFVMILDNARPHRAKKVTSYVEQNIYNLEFLFLPPYSPNLNPSENLWKLLRKKAIHNVYFDSLETLQSKIEDTLNEFSTPSIDRINYCAVI